jgi:hypothetical protein
MSDPFAIAVCLSSMILGAGSAAGASTLPSSLHDRGTGQPTSLFGTYIRAGELLVCPFFEYSTDHNREYQPVQFGFASDTDFRARYRSTAEQIYVGYGFSDRLALEFEAGYLRATFDKASGDHSGTPARIEERGLGDIEAKLRWRWKTETVRWPEIFSFFDVTLPSQRHRRLIGDSDWQFMPGIGLVRDFPWGTMTLRTDLEYNRETKGFDIGETAIEYLKRLSPSVRGFLAVEGGENGAPDEWNLIAEAQWQVTKLLTLKLNSSLGISSKSPDWEPQAGVLFSIPAREP